MSPPQPDYSLREADRLNNHIERMPIRNSHNQIMVCRQKYSSHLIIERCIRLLIYSERTDINGLLAAAVTDANQR
ncbi:hypothetical protein ACFPYJ_16420 [Paenibacillus solisilvae]|uniref:Tn3 transposase DDE domain-containing protein n=1 Tax=Paenibacillus solisilvae TaxID=2486751 RepID=A0ABW0W2S5_9BACL